MQGLPAQLGTAAQLGGGDAQGLGVNPHIAADGLGHGYACEVAVNPTPIQGAMARVRPVDWTLAMIDSKLDCDFKKTLFALALVDRWA